MESAFRRYFPIPVRIEDGKIGVEAGRDRVARGLDELPEPLRSEVRTKYPTFATAPPLDDARPSVSSWDGVKKALGARSAAKAGP